MGKARVYFFAQFFILLTLGGSADAATANVTINANRALYPISPYVSGLNTSSVYYKSPILDTAFITRAKNMKLKMHRFMPGAAGQRYDFRYNNYRGKYWSGGWQSIPWKYEPADRVPSLEEEMRFCNAVGAEPLLEVNSAFCGPNGTGSNKNGTWTGGGDFAGYAGVTLPDTPANRALYAADMVKYLRALCEANGWRYPLYYGIGNEYDWDSQTYDSFLNCVQAYVPAMKAVDPGIKVLFSGSFDSRVKNVMDIFDFHSYAYADTGAWQDSDNISKYVFCPGRDMDGSFTRKVPNGYNRIASILSGYATNLPGKEPAFSLSEWADHSYRTEHIHFGEYRGAMFTAHTLYRAIKNKVQMTCAWYTWSSEPTYHIYGPAPNYNPRPRYFAYRMYQNLGDTLLECYDPAEFNPATQNYFTDYKDDRDDLITLASRRNDGSMAMIATNLSETESYAAQITLNNFTMSGSADVHVMNSTNCAEGGVGPSSSTVNLSGSPFNYTFQPFTVTCIVVKGPADTTAPAAPGSVRDSLGTDASTTYSTSTLSANWTAATDAEIGISGYMYAIGTTAGGTDVAGWTTIDNSTCVIRVGLALTVGQSYYFSVKAINGQGLVGAARNSNGITVSQDTTAPGAISAVRDGTSADIVFTPINTQLSANWDESSDTQSGISGYRYAIGASPGGTNTVNWTDVDRFTTVVTRTGLTLTAGNTYYFAVRAVNGQGTPGNITNSNGQYVTASDLTPPGASPAVRDGTGTADAVFTSATKALSANWDAATDNESGISGYLYAAGTSPGGVNVINWTNVGNVLKMTSLNLNLTVGTTYYVSIKAVNGAGMESAAANSNGQYVTNDPTPPVGLLTVRDGLEVSDAGFTSSTSTLSANWDTALDPESGVVRYWYAIGTAPGGTNVLAWTATNDATDTAAIVTGLNLAIGATYYFSVKAENGAGLQGNPVNTNGQYVQGSSVIIIPPPDDTGQETNAYPNPYSLSSATPLKFKLSGESETELKIFTMSGKLVRKLAAQSGATEISWDGTNEDGEKVTRGIYIYKITENGGDTVTGKLAITR